MKARTNSGGIILWILFLLPLIPVAVFFLFPNFVQRNFTFFEGEAPLIEAKIPPVIGLEPIKFPVVVTDEGAGIDEAVIRIEQQGKRSDILTRKQPASGETLEVQVSARELGLREGLATISVSAFDRTFWSNTSETTQEVRISYSRPRLEVLTAQHNVAVGGTTLVFYRILSGEIARSGVLVQGIAQPGFPASKLDPVFASEPKLHAALIAIPKTFNPDSDRIEAFAEDIAGNVAKASLNYRILRRKFIDAPIQVKEEFLRSRIQDLWPQYQVLDSSAESFDAATASTSELGAAFAKINQNFRALLEAKIRTTLATTTEQRLFEGQLRRPILGSSTSQFGEQRKYLFGSSEISRSEHDGIDLAAVANTVVRAPAGGVVRFADDLGIYGRTVILDHGFGLSTLYGHLSSIGVNVGDSVTPDQALGRTGMTGLAGGDHLHFEIRVHGISVTPIEWWDGKWVGDHILEKINSMKRLLAVEAQQAVPPS